MPVWHRLTYCICYDCISILPVGPACEKPKTRSPVDGAKAVKGQAAKLHNRDCLAAMPLSRPAAVIGARYPPSPPVRCGTGVAVSVALRCRSGGPEAAALRWCLPRARSQFRPFCAGSADGQAGVVVRPPSAGAAVRRVSVTVVGWLRGCLGLQAPEVDTSMPPAALNSGVVLFASSCREYNGRLALGAWASV